MNRFARKTALITGGASGLGKAVAQRLASEGARVVITDICAELGRTTAAECGFTFIEQDVCDETRWVQVVQTAWEYHGSLNILVNNAGMLGPVDPADPENTRLADWKRIFSVNVEGVFLGCRAAIPVIARSGGGAIVNMSSVAGLLATPYATAYGASKAAVYQLTKSIAQHCAQERLNIRCNSVHPGNVRTPLWDRRAEEEAKVRGTTAEAVIEEAKTIIPLGDFTQSEDIAAAVCFLASEEARHITGSQMIVDGGIFHCDTYRVTSRSSSD